MNHSLMFGLSLLLLPNCGTPTDDDDSGPPVPEDCAEDDLYEAVACGQTFCGAPTVEGGTGASTFEALQEGDEVTVRFGAQGGYHIDLTAEMYNLCPIVYLVPTMYVDPGDGNLVEIFTQNRHVQALRIDPNETSQQQFWGIRGFVPCEYWPDDPENNLECGNGAQGSAGHIEDLDVVIKMEAWDHNEGPDGEQKVRYAVDEIRVDPVCCG